MKEFQAAAKEGRQARPDTPKLRDELYGFILGGTSKKQPSSLSNSSKPPSLSFLYSDLPLISTLFPPKKGHETSSTAIVWTLKLLARHQNIQDKFRAALHEYHSRAKRDGDQPTIEEIINPDQPYTDALIEEILRVAGVLPVMARDAMVDTEVLGYVIPKGTQIFMVRTCYLFLVVVVVIVAEFHTIKQVRWEKCCVFNYSFLLTKSISPPQKIRQHSAPISSKPPFPYPKPLVLHLVKRPKRKMAHGILKRLANFNQIAGSPFLRMTGGRWSLTLARDRVSPLEEGFDRVLDAKWPISNCVCC